MTSAELVAFYKGKYKVAQTAVDLSPEEIYQAASLAQHDILTDAGVLDFTGRLALASGQESYTFEPLNITGATNATPIVVTIAGHPYHTGDRITIAGVLGATGANGEWIVTYIDANTFSLDGSTAGGVWASGGKAYHDLMKAWELKRIRMIDPPGRKIFIGDYDTIEEARYEMNSSRDATVIGDDVIQCYQVHEPYLKLVFSDIPPSTIVCEFLAIRGMLECEKIAEDTDPLLPFHYDDVLLQGVRYHVLDKQNDSDAKDEAVKKELKQYEYMLDKIRRRSNRRKFVRKKKGYVLNW